MQGAVEPHPVETIEACTVGLAEGDERAAAWLEQAASIAATMAMAPARIPLILRSARAGS